MTTKVVIGNPILNDNVRHAALALADAGMLETFHTGLDTTQFANLRLGPLTDELQRRTLPAAVHQRARTHPLGELARLAALRLPSRFSPFDPHVGPLSIHARAQSIDRALARAVRRGAANTVYAYEDAAAQAFAAAHDVGARAIYDLPIGYWRAGHELFQQERETRPDWASTLNGLRDPEKKLARKDEELAGADAVIVASTYTAQSLDKYPGPAPRAYVVPYGTPPRARYPHTPHDGPVRVLYVGSLTQRKGLADLFDAMPLTNSPVDLTIVGRPVGECAARDRAMSGVNWIESLPHARILQLVAQSDVLVLPSLFEGFGLVLTEALSQGTPIIATDHTAAPDLLRGIDDAGWVVPIRSPESIAAAIDLLGDPAYRARTREQALAAADRQSWVTYRTRIASIVRGEEQ